MKTIELVGGYWSAIPNPNSGSNEKTLWIQSDGDTLLAEKIVSWCEKLWTAEKGFYTIVRTDTREYISLEMKHNFERRLAEAMEGKEEKPNKSRWYIDPFVKDMISPIVHPPIGLGAFDCIVWVGFTSPATAQIFAAYLQGAMAQYRQDKSDVPKE